MVFQENKYRGLVYFPKTIHSLAITFEIEFTSSIDNHTFSYVVMDEGGLSDFYVFYLDFDDFPENAEYIYKITDKDNGGEIEHGLLRLGDYTQPSANYNPNIEYKQYEG